MEVRLNIPTLAGNPCPWYVPQAACDACADACKSAVLPWMIAVTALAGLMIAGGVITFTPEKPSKP